MTQEETAGATRCTVKHVAVGDGFVSEQATSLATICTSLNIWTTAQYMYLATHERALSYKFYIS